MISNAGSIQTGESSTEGRLVYAIGDIHGRADLLKALVSQILADAIEIEPASRPIVVLLGDYVDRGPSSRDVVDFILSLKQHQAIELRCLRGNHEQALMNFLEHSESGRDWAKVGGVQTLASYGVQAPPPYAPAKSWSAAQQQFEHLLPERHLAFFSELELLLVVGDYAFVHAGVVPSRPLDEQDEDDLLWITHAFTDSQLPLQKVIVHGHSAHALPQLAERRICVDTGAYATNILTAVRLQDASQNLIQVRMSAPSTTSARFVS